MKLIAEIVRQCVGKGIIKDTGISIDATHTEVNAFKAIPERVMKRLVEKIFKTYKFLLFTIHYSWNDSYRSIRFRLAEYIKIE